MGSLDYPSFHVILQDFCEVCGNFLDPYVSDFAFLPLLPYGGDGTYLLGSRLQLTYKLSATKIGMCVQQNLNQWCDIKTFHEPRPSDDFEHAILLRSMLGRAVPTLRPTNLKICHRRRDPQIHRLHTPISICSVPQLRFHFNFEFGLRLDPTLFPSISICFDF
uniref:Uncharacterized protein n=1 Tax=Cucumis melo TaxID=3656 RepID=A0A9I9E970_CUCME